MRRPLPQDISSRVLLVRGQIMQCSLSQLLILACLILSACAPTHAPRVSAWELQAEQARLAAKTQDYYREQQARVERLGRQLLAQVPDAPSIQFSVVQGDSNINAGATFGKVRVTDPLCQSRVI